MIHAYIGAAQPRRLLQQAPSIDAITPLPRNTIPLAAVLAANNVTGDTVLVSSLARGSEASSALAPQAPPPTTEGSTLFVLCGADTDTYPCTEDSNVSIAAPSLQPSG